MDRVRRIALLLALCAAPAVGAPGPDEKPPPPCVGWGLLFFDSGSAKVTPVAAAILDNFLSGMRANTYPSNIKLNGHTDRVGGPEANELLSRRRAEAVRDYLVARGIDASRVEVKASGESRPLVETVDGVSEAQNRYVDFTEILDPAEWKRRDVWWASHARPSIVC